MGRKRKELDLERYSHRLADSIRQRRERANLNQEELAESLGVSAATVFAWENGRMSPEWDRVPEIAEALGVKIHTLLPAE